MKESEILREKCLKIQQELLECVKEQPFKARYLGWCGKLSIRLSKCQIEHVSSRLQLPSNWYKLKFNSYFRSLNNRGKNTTKQLCGRGIEEKAATAIMLSRIPKIENSFAKLQTYPSVTERYYKKLYFRHDLGPRLEHHCILMHTNKICLITLAPTHPIVKEKKRISKLDFQVTNKLDRLENKVSGKGKKGGQHITPNSTLCFVECEDGARYTIWGCIKGKLVEINPSFLKDPNIILEKPLSQGFVAIILPSIKDMEEYKSKLLTQESYESEVLSFST